MNRVPFLFLSLLLILSILDNTNLYGGVDSLNTSYIKISPIKIENIKETSLRDFFNKRFRNQICFNACTNQYLMDLYFVIDTASQKNIKLISIFADSTMSITTPDKEKTFDSLYCTNTELRVMGSLLLNDLSLVYDLKHKNLYYKWSNPSGKNEPSLSKKNKLLPGTQFPDLKFKNLNGQDISVKKDRIKVINWWATSCLPCREEIPGLNELVKKYTGQNIDFIAIVSDSDNVQKFLKQNNFSYEQCYSDSQTPVYFGNAFPRHVIIDKYNKIVYNSLGGSKETFKELEKVIVQLLEKN